HRNQQHAGRQCRARRASSRSTTLASATRTFRKDDDGGTLRGGCGGSRNTARHAIAILGGEGAEASEDRAEHRTPEELVLAHVVCWARRERIRDGRRVETRDVVRTDDEAPAHLEVLAATHVWPKHQPRQRPTERDYRAVQK